MAVRIRSALVRAHIAERVTPDLGKSAIVTRDLCRYYALLGREHPGPVFRFEECDAILAALPRFRERRGADEDYTVPRALREVLLERGVDRAEVDDVVARLVGLRDSELIALIDRLEAAAERERRKALRPAGKTMWDVWFTA